MEPWGWGGVAGAVRAVAHPQGLWQRQVRAGRWWDGLAGTFGDAGMPGPVGNPTRVARGLWIVAARHHVYAVCLDWAVALAAACGLAAGPWQAVLCHSGCSGALATVVAAWEAGTTLPSFMLLCGEERGTRLSERARPAPPPGAPCCTELIDVERRRQRCGGD